MTLRMPHNKKRSDERGDDVRRARAAILADAGNPPKGRGEIACPICGEGRITYTVSARWRVWASCRTKGCVQWTE